MMTLTRYGIREWGGGGLIALILLAAFLYIAWRWMPWTGSILAAIVVILYVALAAFFRSPSRTIPADPALIVSPADGVVKDIEVVEDFKQEPFEGRALRIGIFLSVFNVHVNRAAADWSVVSKHYREGRYLDARDPNCARENEAMTLAGWARAGERKFPLAIRQISGAIARRIVCPAEPGNKYRKGAIYGMIKFGSRTELYLPADDDFAVTVKIGDRVYAGETVMARLNQPLPDRN